MRDTASPVSTCSNAVEGASGFYVEVVCNDAAAPPGQRSYYGSDANGSAIVTINLMDNGGVLNGGVVGEADLPAAAVATGRAGAR